MNTHLRLHATAPLRKRVMIALVLGGGIMTWVIAAILMLAAAPPVIADPALSDAADVVHGVILAS